MNVVIAPARRQIQSSYASLWAGSVGFLLLGLGNILATSGALTYPGRLSWLLQFAGPVLIAIAVTLHVDHLSFRIGRPAVLLIITGSYLLGVCVTPFVISPELWTNRAWSNVAQGLWALGLFCLSFGLAAIAVHKERQIERGIKQAHDIGDNDPTNASVHASFLTLAAGSAGFLLYAVGYVQLLEVVGGTRWSWILQVAGCTLLAVAAISHLEHLTLHLGLPAVVLGVIGAITLAISSIPFVIDTANYTSSVFWAQSFWFVWGFGSACGAVSIFFVILRKRAMSRLY